MSDCTETLYSLEEIATCFQVNLPSASQTSDTMAKSIIEAIMPDVSVSSGSITPAAQCLSTLYTSSDQRPDIVVKGNNGEFLFIVEVHSGDDSNSFLGTINKCVYVTINALRLLRCVNSDVSTITSLTSFVFPKSSTQKCVIMVEVMFHHFNFVYTLRTVALSAIQETLIEEAQSYPLPGMQEVQMYGDLVIKLNESERLAVCNFTLPLQRVLLQPQQVTQLRSTSAIVLDDGEFIFKLSSTALSQHFLYYLYITMFNPLRYSIDLHSTEGFLSYKKVKYDPLEPQEVYDCLKEFTEQMHTILQELHEAGFAHCDLRPENICIDVLYHLILIDMDRVTTVTCGLPVQGFAATCMVYDTSRSKKAMDYWEA